MNQISCIQFGMSVAIAIILISNCVVCHEKSANVNRKRRLTDDDAMQLQQHQQQQQFQQHHLMITTNEPNTDQRYINMFKDRFNSDKIIFDRGTTTTTTTTTTGRTSSINNNNNMPKSNETSHQYSGTDNGEYQFSLIIRNGIRRVESGEFEEHNGEKVFIVRGFFEHITKDGGVKLTAYIFDRYGYHEIPVTTSGEGVTDFYAPDQHDCDLAKGVYCIDRKLLSLMVG